MCSRYLSSAGDGRHLNSLLPYVRNGLLHVFPCEEYLLDATIRGRILLAAHEDCCRDFAIRVGSASGLVSDLCAVVLDYAIPAKKRIPTIG